MSVSDTASLGQLLIIGLHDLRWSSRLERTLRNLQPSGVLFFGECLRTPGQTAELLHRIGRALSTPPFLAIAEEGGSVNPLEAFLPLLPAPRVVSRRGSTGVRRSGELIGAALNLLGFNLNLAPRLDLANPNVRPALDAQTFGADPKEVARCGKAFIEGLRKHKILACGKHFPGRGAPEYDKNGLPTVGKTMGELWHEDLWPFRELLPHLPFVKVSNVSYKAYDFDAPRRAAMSGKVVNDLLRVKLRYRGLAVADLLEPLEETSLHAGPEEAAAMDAIGFTLSTKAGCDLQVVKWGERLADYLLREMRRELEAGSLSQGRVAEALGRIRTAKKGLRRPSGKLSVRSFDRLAREFEKFDQLVKAGGESEA
jgi:beta-N-acetylhexosaminidase